MKARHNGEVPSRAMHADHIRVLNWGGDLKVLDAKGNAVPGIIACDVAMRPGVPPLMRLNLAAGNFDVDGLPTFSIIDPTTGRFRPIKRVEFADGGDDFVPVVHVAAPAPPVVAQPEAAAASAPETGTAPNDAPSPATDLS
jgi:hypothetical protein